VSFKLEGRGGCWVTIAECKGEDKIGEGKIVGVEIIEGAGSWGMRSERGNS